MAQNKPLIISRMFDATKEAVFNAFADAGSLAQWWGPVEAPIDVVSLDFRPGGKFHYRMKGPVVYYGLFQYLEIKPFDLLVWLNSFASETGEVIKAPFPGLDFPLEVHITITLEEVNGQTRLTLISKPHNATDGEQAAFAAIFENMQQGFGGTLNQLEAFLARK